MNVHHLPMPARQPRRLSERDANEALSNGSAGAVAARRRKHLAWPLWVQVVAGFAIGVSFGLTVAGVAYYGVRLVVSLL